MKEVKVYTKDPCPYCERAIQLLTEQKVAFTEVDLTGKDAEIQKLKDQTGWRTVPMIFIGDKMIGGYTELKALHSSGDLLKEIGA